MGVGGDAALLVSVLFSVTGLLSVKQSEITFESQNSRVVSNNWISYSRSIQSSIKQHTWEHKVKSKEKTLILGKWIIHMP